MRQHDDSLGASLHTRGGAGVNVRFGQFQKCGQDDAKRSAIGQIRGQNTRIPISFLVAAAVGDQQNGRLFGHVSKPSVAFSRHVMEAPGGCDMLNSDTRDEWDRA